MSTFASWARLLFKLSYCCCLTTFSKIYITFVISSENFIYVFSIPFQRMFDIYHGNLKGKQEKKTNKLLVSCK